jgi:hypothetical protein
MPQKKKSLVGSTQRALWPAIFVELLAEINAMPSKLDILQQLYSRGRIEAIH